MSKACAKCQKTVYPIEELKCLDKAWHKGCFKCTECGMTLNMKTYKGFDKMPYCEAHVPKAKATTVADTPEFKRISENTKIQSNAVYHAEFEKAKGKFTTVADDPELMRIKANTKIISNVAYHGDLEKKAQMEQKRNLGDGDGDMKNKNGGHPPKSPPSYMDEISSVPTSSHPSHHQQSYNSQQGHHQQQSYNRGSHHEETSQSYSNSRQYSSQQSHGHAASMNNSSQGRERERERERERDPYQHQQHQQVSHHQHQQPAHHHGGQPPQPQQQYQSPYSSRGQANVIYTSDGGPVNVNASRKVGSIADYDPMNNHFGSASQHQARMPPQQQSAGYGSAYSSYPQQQQQPSHMQMPHQAPKHQVAPPPQPQYTGVRYRALYDYEAQDVDELAFLEGDLIVDCTSIDEGWLTGTNLRSKQRGMLPANYVQQA